MRIIDEDKVKFIILISKMDLPELNIVYGNIKIWHFSMVETLVCYHSSNLSGEYLTSKFFKKINSNYNFLYRWKQLLNVELRRLLWNALIQPHFGFRYSPLYLLIFQNLKKLYLSQIKCIRFFMTWSKASD